jgi:hypothetical protein
LFLKKKFFLAINFGGIGNFVQFAINEGLSNSTKLNSSISTIEQQVTSVVAKPTTSITTHEIKDHTDANQSNTNNHPDETPPDNDIISYNNRLPSEHENMIDININIIDETNSVLRNDDDVLTEFDATNLASANSANILLNDDQDFQQELDEYTSHCSYP